MFHTDVLDLYHPQCKVKSKSSWQCVSCGSKPACGSERCVCVCVPECLISHNIIHVICSPFSSSTVDNFRLMGQTKLLSKVYGAGSGAGRQCLSALPLRWSGRHTEHVWVTPAAGSQRTSCQRLFCSTGVCFGIS